MKVIERRHFCLITVIIVSSYYYPLFDWLRDVEFIISVPKIVIFHFLLKATYLVELVYHISLQGRWGPTDDFTTIPLYLFLCSAALVLMAKYVPVLLLFTWLSLVMSVMVSFCAVLFPTRCLG